MMFLIGKDLAMIHTPPYRTIATWLYFCAFMIFMMAIIGAITRLTESGLSITEWKPVTGALPPLHEADWQREFDLYKKTPEYTAKHFWMDLDDFKKIYFWEWLHRLWGRLIGLVYVLPLIWFVARKQLPKGDGWAFAGLLALGGAQGFMGWFMVQSGLVDRPSVSHFRLAAHLGLALLLFSLILWMAHRMLFRANGIILAPISQTLPVAHRPLGWFALFMVSITILWGAFVAGLDAGMIYNQFPMMGAGFVPDDFGNIHSSPAGVQFIHRWLAVITFFSVLGYGWMIRPLKVAPLLAGMVTLQVILGIATLLTQVQIILASLHQAGAIILLGLMVTALYQTRAQK